MSNLNVDLIISDRPNYGDNSAVSLYSQLFEIDSIEKFQMAMLIVAKEKVRIGKEALK